MLVKDRMTHNPITITADTSFPDAFRMIREKKIRHLPVVDKGKLIGIVAQTDLLHASPSSATTLTVFEINYLLANLHVREVMTSPPITVPKDAPLEQAAHIMVEKKIGCLPVMSNGNLVGVITETDIFEAFLEVLGSGEPSLRVTLRVSDVRGELARLSGVIAHMGANICSVASFQGEEPGHTFVTFRLEGVDKETLLSTLQAGGEHVAHICDAT